MSAVFKIGLSVPSIDAVGPMELMLESLSAVVTSFATGEADIWRIEVYVEGMPDYASVERLVAGGAAAAGIAAPDFLLEPLPDIDWVEENQKSFEPISAGRFFVHPSDWAGRAPSGAWPVAMDAGMAFGTGSHATTRGCLLMLDRLAKARRPSRILDLGSGTGILAIGAAHAFRNAAIIASDIDWQAVLVCRDNCRANGAGGRIAAVQATGMAHPAIARRAPYDLILANILARPLCDLARAVSSALARPGDLILSGLLAEQIPMVLSAYRRHGLHLSSRQVIDGWATLHLRRGG